MASIVFVTDSTAGLKASFAQENNIQVVPLYMQTEDSIYRDGVDLTAKDFYELLPSLNKLPTTSQPSVGDFVSVYSELIEKGAEAIVSVHIPSGISGTTNSARLAAEQFPKTRIEIIDMTCPCAAAQLAIEAGVRANLAGESVDAVVKAVEAVSESHGTVFMVDTLEYLHKGGRIGGASALVGSVLKFKPLLYFNDRKIDAIGRERGAEKALDAMLRIMDGWMPKDEPLKAVMMVAQSEDRAERILQKASGILNIVEVDTAWLSPVIGAHVGPGCLGMCCCPMDKLHI